MYLSGPQTTCNPRPAPAARSASTTRGLASCPRKRDIGSPSKASWTDPSLPREARTATPERPPIVTVPGKGTRRSASSLAILEDVGRPRDLVEDEAGQPVGKVEDVEDPDRSEAPAAANERQVGGEVDEHEVVANRLPRPR